MTVINQPTCTLFTDTERFTQLSAYYEEERAHHLDDAAGATSSLF